VDAIAFAALGAGVGGLVSAIAGLWASRRAEHSLVEAIRGREELKQRLETIRGDLQTRAPDPSDVVKASDIIVGAAGVLSKRQKRSIVGPLRHGSDRSRANYVSKLLDEVSK
jgi:hypothetical protein